MRRLPVTTVVAIVTASCGLGRPASVPPSGLGPGCFRLEAGPWLTPSGMPLESSLAALNFVLPAVVELRSERSNQPIVGHSVLRPQPTGEPFRSATWAQRGDSLHLEWSTGGRLGDATLLVKLGPFGDGAYHGRAIVETDYVEPRPYRLVVAKRVPCDGTGVAASVAACRPLVDGAFHGPPPTGLRSGSYHLTLVATEGSRRGRSTSGTLRLSAAAATDRSPRTGTGVGNDVQRAPFYGSTDIDFAAVGAPVFRPRTNGAWPSPGSEDPVFPGVLVLEGQHPVDSGRASATILIATVQNRRDGAVALDGAGIGLSVRGGKGSLFQGPWREWGLIVDGRGFFCLELLQ